jgi:DNA invertase Pin-like site-specific DNA recombinase
MKFGRALTTWTILLITDGVWHTARVRQVIRGGRGQGPGKSYGRRPKLSRKQQAELCRMYASGDYSIADLAELFTVSRPTVYRILQRSQLSETG